jgi:hypothetical protein
VLGLIRFRFLLAVLAAALVWMVWRELRPRIPAADPPAVLMQVRQLQQLATVRYTLQKIVGIREPKLPVGEESILLIMQAAVEAGVDLTALQERDIVTRDGTLFLRLPRGRILNVIVDDQETKVWDRQKTWWAPWIPYSLDLEQRARLSGREAIEKAATDMGIAGQAERNAESSIKALLALAGIRSVVVTFGGS